MTRGRLPQRAGSPSLNSGGTGHFDVNQCSKLYVWFWGWLVHNFCGQTAKWQQLTVSLVLFSSTTDSLRRTSATQYTCVIHTQHLWLLAVGVYQWLQAQYSSQPDKLHTQPTSIDISTYQPLQLQQPTTLIAKQKSHTRDSRRLLVRCKIHLTKVDT